MQQHLKHVTGYVHEIACETNEVLLHSCLLQKVHVLVHVAASIHIQAMCRYMMCAQCADT